jgi:hypothetical protein
VVPRLELAGRRFTDVPTAFSLDDDGLFADAYLVGQVGANLLAGHRVVLDLARARVAIV